MPNTRFTFVFRFDATSLADAKDFARGVRRAGRTRNQYEWERRNARLLRVKTPEGYVSGMFRAEAVVKFDAVSLTDARMFASEQRRAARAGVPAPLRWSSSWQGWQDRDAALLRVQDALASVVVIGEQDDTAETPETPTEA